MARPQAADYEERKQVIVDNAAELFASQSFLGTSINDIARKCGFSKSLLYHYYGSKEDLLYAAMSSHIDRLEQMVADVLDLRGSTDGKLHTLLRMFMSEYSQAAAKQKILVSELANLAEADRIAIVAKQRRIVEKFQSLIVEIDASLEGNPHKARAKTMLVFGMINWTSNWYNPGGPIKPSEIADMVTDLILSEK